MRILYLLPNLLDPEGVYLDYMPKSIEQIVSSLNGIFAESEKGARRYLLRFMTRDAMQKVSIKLLNEHTSSQSLHEYIHLIGKDQIWGVVSDAGLPILADPGSKLVLLAHKKNIQVKTLTGPSSIMMALLLSGFSGQAFTFHGYLPRKEPELISRLKSIEKDGQLSTQIWIETPYRTEKMIQTCINSLDLNTIFCVASALCSKKENVITTSIKSWKTGSFSVGKEPAVFLLSRKK